MEETNQDQPFNDIWSIKDDVVEKNEEIKKKVFDASDEDLEANNVSGYVINEVGNIVAKFGFFVETEGQDRIDMKVSMDGFMAAIYNRKTNILLGYGHPLGFTGLVDPKESTILHLGPDAANGEQIIISIGNDEKLKEQGVVVMIRDKDVMTELLPEEVQEDFAQSLEDASLPIDDLNEIETSYNEYMRHLYNVLGEVNKDTVPVEEVEVHE